VEHNPMSMSQSRLTLGHRHLMSMSFGGIGPRMALNLRNGALGMRMDLTKMGCFMFL